MKHKKSIEELDILIKKFQDIDTKFPLSEIYKEIVVELQNQRNEVAAEIGKKKA